MPATAVFGPPPTQTDQTPGQPIDQSVDQPTQQVAAAPAYGDTGSMPSIFRSALSTSTGGLLPVPATEELSPRGYQPQFAEPSEAAQPSGRRRTVITAVVAILAVIAGGLWLSSYLRDRPIKAALEDSTTAYAGVVEAMAAADSLDDIAAVGETARRVAGRVDLARSEITGDSDLASAAAGVVSAQASVVAAAAPLADLTPDDLEVWGSVEVALMEAADEVNTAKTSLAAVDDGLAQAVTNPTGAIENLGTIVGSSAQDRLTGIASGLLDALVETSSTADIREVAASAADSRAAVRAAAAGLAQGAGEREVRAVTRLVAAIASLKGLDRDHLGVWAKVRPEIVGARVTGANVDPAIEHVTDLVAKAKVTMQRWREKVAAIREEQDADLAEIATYADPVDDALERYDGLRSELASFLERAADEGDDDEGPDGPPGRYTVGGEDVAAFLAEAADGRRSVGRTLRGISPPSEYSDEHDDLLAAVRGAARAVEQALFELNDGCFDCRYVDSTSYRNLVAASDDVADTYSAAVSAYEAAVGDDRDRISSRKLPPKPTV